ncbi:MAG: sulfatase-like hydrolase/transferase [Planctomycetota bacterium]|jgi:arylsulfatase A-like enzyme
MGHTNTSGPSSPLTHGVDTFVGWKSQTIAHTYYPSTFVEDGVEIPLEPGVYLHDIVMAKARDFIAANAKAGKPFFCYIPTAVPHAAMHAPEALHNKWRKVFPEFDDKIGKYGAGKEDCPDVINPIAGFAAMMENLDNEIGAILNQLEDLGIDDNTLILFASDNGAHREGGHDPKFWNSTGSLRGMKRDMHEGGIRTPMLARWPGVVKPGATTDHISAFWDILPTIADILGQPVPPQNDGISFLPTLKGQPGRQKKHEYLYWEFCKGPDQTIFSRAVRQGKWKAYQQAGKEMEIFNLNQDPYEQNDLAAKMPERVAKMKAIMKEAHVPLPSQK